MGDLVHGLPGDTAAQLPSLVLNHADQPVVAFLERRDATGLADGFVYEWAETTWRPVGSSLDAEPGALNGFDYPSLAQAPDGKLFLAWQEPQGAEMFVHVWVYDDGTWVPVGSRMDLIPGEGAISPDLVVDSTGAPIVGWIEGGGLYVSRWDGASWANIGGRLDVVVDDTWPSPAGLAVDASDRLLVVWTEPDTSGRRNVHVRRRDGASWEILGDGITATATGTATNPTIDVLLDVPVIAWRETVGATSALHVRRLSSAGWVSVGDAVTEALGVEPVGQPDLGATDSEVFVAFETATGEIVVAHHDGTVWSDSGLAGARGSHPDLRLDGCGVPVLAYESSTASATAIRVARSAR